MKRTINILLVISFIFLLSGCFKRDEFEDIQVYTTAYPIEYITSYLYGEHSNVSSIYPNGVDIESYTLKNKQLTTYSEGDLFVFNGLSKEKDYVVPMVNKNNNLKIIDTTLTMEYTYGVEELWLDPSNFLMLTQNIRNGLKEYINNHYLKNEIDEKYDELKLQVSEIDAEMKLMAESSNSKTIVVSSDTFKFLEKYNLNVISLEENNELNEKTIETVRSLIYSGDIDYIYLKGNETVSKTITAIANDTNVELVRLHPLSNLSEKEIKNNSDYISIMTENLSLLKNELYD